MSDELFKKGVQIRRELGKSNMAVPALGGSVDHSCAVKAWEQANGFALPPRG
jgi:hypothetical protein